MALKLVPLTSITIATAGTRQQITTTLNPNTASIIVQADTANTGNIYLGDSTVASTKGLQLAPGASIQIDGPFLKSAAQEFVLNDLWLDTATNSNIARVAYLINR